MLCSTCIALPPPGRGGRKRSGGERAEAFYLARPRRDLGVTRANLSNYLIVEHLVVVARHRDVELISISLLSILQLATVPLGFPIKNRRGSIVERDSRSRGSIEIEQIKVLNQSHSNRLTKKEKKKLDCCARNTAIFTIVLTIKLK